MRQRHWLGLSVAMMLLCGCRIPGAMNFDCPCAEGFTCVEDRCVENSDRDAARPNTFDAGFDAAVDSGVDAGADSGLEDAGWDAGPRDAGVDAFREDAGPMLPEPVFTYHCDAPSSIPTDDSGRCDFSRSEESVAIGSPVFQPTPAGFTIFLHLSFFQNFEDTPELIVGQASHSGDEFTWKLVSGPRSESLAFVTSMDPSRDVRIEARRWSWNKFAIRYDRDGTQAIFNPGYCAEARAVPFEPSNRLVSVGGVLSGAEEHHYNGLLDGLTFYDEALTDEQLRVLLGPGAARGCRVVDE